MFPMGCVAAHRKYVGSKVSPTSNKEDSKALPYTYVKAHQVLPKFGISLYKPSKNWLPGYYGVTATIFITFFGNFEIAVKK
jgi:hypothetical protein